MSQATLDHPTTKAELDNFYGIEKTHRVHDEIVETITKTVRKVSHKALGVPYLYRHPINNDGHVR